MYYKEEDSFFRAESLNECFKLPQTWYVLPLYSAFTDGTTQVQVQGEEKDNFFPLCLYLRQSCCHGIISIGNRMNLSAFEIYWHGSDILKVFNIARAASESVKLKSFENITSAGTFYLNRNYSNCDRQTVCLILVFQK